MDQVNIIKENKNIPEFIFEYFAQKNISGLMDETLETTCLFHFNEADGPSQEDSQCVLIGLVQSG